MTIFLIKKTPVLLTPAKTILEKKQTDFQLGKHAHLISTLHTKRIFISYLSIILNLRFARLFITFVKLFASKGLWNMQKEYIKKIPAPTATARFRHTDLL